MIAAYYNCEADSKELFSRFKIASCESFKKYLNKYDTIFLNMQEFFKPERYSRRNDCAD